MPLHGENIPQTCISSPAPWGPQVSVLRSPRVSLGDPVGSLSPTGPGPFNTSRSESLGKAAGQSLFVRETLFPQVQQRGEALGSKGGSSPP